MEDYKDKTTKCQITTLIEQFTRSYAQQDKEVKKACRQDKRDYFDKLAEEAENAAHFNDMKTMYITTKKLGGKFGSGNDGPLKIQNGKIISKDRRAHV